MVVTFYEIELKKILKCMEKVYEMHFVVKFGKYLIVAETLV